MADSSEEKTIPASDRKLEKAREEGQVAHSKEATMAGALLGVVLVLYGAAEPFAQRLQSLIRTALEPWGRNLTDAELQRRLMLMLVDLAVIVIPVLAAALLLAVAVGFAQASMGGAGFKLSMKAVALKFDRVNPGKGLTKLISLKSMVKLAITVVKAVVIGFAMWRLIVYLLPLGVGSAYFEPHAIAQLAWAVLMRLLMLALLLSIVLGPVEYALERWLFLKDQRMGKSEAKRDYKESQGDPVIKGARDSLRRQFAREDASKAVPQASAVVVNPTHYAVALAYSRGSRQLPKVVAKGVDDQALAIKRLALDSGVPVFTNPPLARALHQVPINGSIPQALMEPVAAVMRWVEGLAQPEPTRAET
jgi:type III secretion protein U